MPKISLIIASVLLVFVMFGCTAKPKASQEQSITDSATSYDFATQKKRAGEFWELFRQGLAYKKSGQYDDAVASFESALKNHSLLRPEQSAAAKQLVLVLEQLGDYEKAIKYCEIGAEITMNDDQRKFFNDMKEKFQQVMASQP